MTNEERREALNQARKNALQWATWAERNFERETVTGVRIRAEMATMWADVANAMKDGDPDHDGTDGRPTVPELRRALANRSKFTTPHDVDL